MPPLNLTPPKTVDFSQVSTVKNVNLGNQYGVGGQGFSTQTPTNSTTQALTPAVGALFGLDKAAQLPLSVTSPKVGLLFDLDKAASQPMTVTGNPQSGLPVAMDLNKRSDRRLMRRYIRSLRDAGNIAKGVSAWQAVRNMRNGQNLYGIQWDSTGHLIQRTLPSLPIVGVPLGLLLSWDNSLAGINKLNTMQSSSILNTVNGITNNGTLLNQMLTAALNVAPTINTPTASTTNTTSARRNSTGRQTPTTPVMEDENGRQYTVVNNSYVPIRTLITELDTDYMEDENGRQYKMVNGRYVPVRRNGGILKAQQGAPIQTKNSNTPALDAIMNNPLLAEQFLAALSQQLGKEITLEDLTTAATNPETGAQLEQLAQQMMKQSAKQGAKLEYISRLRGKCPEGQELVYFAKGGKICSACMGKKLEDGGEPEYMRKFRAKKGCKLKK